MPWLLVAMGGAAGSLARFAVGLLLMPLIHRWGFPAGTMTVNLLGCFLIGLLHAVLLGRGSPDAHRFFWIAGFLGGFTTFSSFGLETMGLLRQGHHLRAMLNVLVSNVAGIALVFAGYALGSK
jgi:fluoride exporter